MKNKPNFSVCVIAKNEEKTLPRLAESLKEFSQRGGEKILLDTGSTDDTIKVATDLGFIVYGVGDKFVKKLDKKTIDNINEAFVVSPEENVVEKNARVFNFGAARNFIAGKASNDMIAMPDCDEEYTQLDLDVICKVIDDGIEQLEYNFVYSHDEFGNEAIKFLHCKFYDRRKLHW